MKTEPKIIENLNNILMTCLTLINQHFLHARICKDWGYETTASKYYKMSIKEMKQAEKLMDRVLLLEGLPNLQRLGNLSIGETVSEQYDLEAKTKLEFIKQLRSSIDYLLNANDHVSRNLIEEILEVEEEHLDWIESQVSVIKNIGVEGYLGEQLG